MIVQWLEDVIPITHKPLPTYKELDANDTRTGYVNSSNRPGTSKIDTIVLHYTAAGGHMGSWKWFAMPEARASAHFLVGRDGEIVQCLPVDVKAWHTGASSIWDPVAKRSFPNVNDFSVGIEIANFGSLYKEGTEFYLERGSEPKRYKKEIYGEPQSAILHFNGASFFTSYWEPYPDVQVEAVVSLCRILVDALKIPSTRIVGHQDISLPIGRKHDPGPLWPWDKLEAEFSVDSFPSRKTW